MCPSERWRVCVTLAQAYLHLGELDASTYALVLGAAKANFGHMEPTAGMLGLVKASISYGTRDYSAGMAHLLRVNPLVLSCFREHPPVVPMQNLLATSQDKTLRHFANGCLINMKAVLAPNFKPTA